jgi:hypothetical protein
VVKIDDRVEPLVREALTAVVKHDPERLQRALEAFPDDDTMTKGTQLAVAVSLYVLHEVYGRRPTEAELRAVAGKVADLENWAGVATDEVMAFLTAAFDRTRVDQILPLDRVALLAYVVAGNLLASLCKDGEWWFNYLDRVEAVIETT